MISIFSCFVLLPIVSFSATSDFSLKGDPCAVYDSCHSKSVPKTCSCERDCHEFGTCCHDASKSKKDVPGYRCYDRRAANPVFVKKSCSDDFRGHVAYRISCLDHEEDELDVKNNLPMTSRRTKVTYWDKDCAKCNNEAAADLEAWNVKVTCPRHEDVIESTIRTNLTFDENKKQWGLVVGGEFLNCALLYVPPLYLNKAKRCTPNVISSCPVDYNDEQISGKCSQYYAQRKLRNSDLHFKNVHCAICNNADVKELECPGMSSKEENSEEEGFGDTIEEVFYDGEWLVKDFACSKGFIYDPAREKCRPYEFEAETTTVLNSAPDCRQALAIVVFLAFLLL